MLRQDKLAVLMPVYNGGRMLLESLRSCATSGLPASEYEIIVADNCSSDHAIDGLPESDDAGARIHVIRGEKNIGRVGNWNRAVQLASDLGFQYLTFLFVGDRWCNGLALRRLLSLIRSSRASVGFAPFTVVERDGISKRQSRRFYVDTGTFVCGAHRFLTGMLESGMFPLGPLQANIYRLDDHHRLIFNTAEPTRTDVQATFDFVHLSGAPVVIGSTPFLEWRERPGRFHATMGTAKTIEDYMKTFQQAVVATQLPVHLRRAKSRVVLNSLRLIVEDEPPRKWPGLFSVAARCASRTPYGFSLFHFLQTIWYRVALRRRLLQFG